MFWYVLFDMHLVLILRQAESLRAHRESAMPKIVTYSWPTPPFTSSMLAIETLEQGAKYVQR